MKKYLFETTPCGRCGGSGRFGGFGVCFGCGGGCVKLTKIGAKAARFLRELRTVKASELQVGDIVEATGLTNGGDTFHYNATVTAIEESEQTCVSNGVEMKYDYEVMLSHKKFEACRSIVFASSVFVVKNRDDKAKIAEALEFQEKLKAKAAARKVKRGQQSQTETRA